MIPVIVMLLTVLSGFLGDILDARIVLDQDNDISLSIRGVIIFVFIVEVAIYFFKYLREKE